MTAGQRAMATAMIYPEPATKKRKGSGSLEAKDQGFFASLAPGAPPKACARRVPPKLHQPTVHRGNILQRTARPETSARYIVHFASDVLP